MSQIQTLVDTLIEYKELPHHTDPDLKQALHKIQTWQKHRLKRTHQDLFDEEKTTLLAHYLVERIYSDDAFDVLADQLLVAGENALNGSGKLEKLIPSNALEAGVLGVQVAVENVKLDLALARILHEQERYEPIDGTIMSMLYKTANAKSARLEQAQKIAYVCEQSHKYFTSFILQNAFKLAKGMAYDNGYQPLYDFIGDGLVAMKPLKRIDDFTVPFVANELVVIHEIHEWIFNFPKTRPFLPKLAYNKGVFLNLEK